MAASTLTMALMSNKYHTPVLLKACIDHLQISPNGVYVDLTFGGGGHSAAILARLDSGGKLFAFDQDAEAQKNALKDKRFTLVPENFRYLKSYLRLHGVTAVNGILGDLGVSSHQFDEAERGFSIRHDAPLDMRMNRQNPLTAREVINAYDDRDLLRIFREYAEVPNAGKLVREIVAARSSAEIVTTEDLKNAIRSCTPKFEAHKYLAKVFQGLRIEVNQEMEALRDCLRQCVEILASGARLVVISYHSLEDRMVKNVMRTGDPDGKEERDIIYGTSKKIMKIVTQKPITPDEAEIAANTRARSARLRVAEKI